MRRPRIHAERAFPVARQRHHRFVPQHEPQRLGVAHEPALWVLLEHAHSDDISAWFQNALPHLVHPGIFHPCAGSDPLPIDVSGIHLVDHAQVQGCRAGRRRVWKREFLAEPADAGHIGHAQLLEAAGDRDGLPTGIVQSDSRPRVALQPGIIFIIPMHDVVAVFGSAPGLQALQLGQLRVKVLQVVQGLRAGPGFRRRAAQAVFNQANGHMHVFPHPTREEVGHRGEAPVFRDGLRGADFPASLRNRGWRIGGMRLDLVEAYFRLVGRLDFFRAVACPSEAQLHVRLAATQPNVPDEDVPQLHVLRAVNCDRVGSAGRWGLNLRLPAAIGTTHGSGRMAGNFHPHLLPWLGPSPNRVRFAALENHVVAEHRADEWQRGRVCRGRSYSRDHHKG